MILTVAGFIVIMFGIFILATGFLMLFMPEKARELLRKFASTSIINYAEITIRLVVGIALFLYSDVCKYPEVFKLFGWFMIVTALILYVVPRRIHHKFSTGSADVIKPVYFRCISPFAFVFGIFIIYNTTWV